MRAPALSILVLAGFLLAPPCRADETDTNAVTGQDLKSASERIRQTGMQLQKDIQERLQRNRRERMALQERQTTERRQEAERAQIQAERDRAALAATREARAREALVAEQEKSRKEAAARVAEVERLREAEIREKDEQAADLERAQQESLDAYKAGSRKQKLGSEAQFGVDL